MIDALVIVIEIYSNTNIFRANRFALNVTPDLGHIIQRRRSLIVNNHKKRNFYGAIIVGIILYRNEYAPVPSLVMSPNQPRSSQNVADIPSLSAARRIVR